MNLILLGWHIVGQKHTQHYDSASGQWTKKADFPDTVYRPFACLLPDEANPNRYIIAGGGSRADGTTSNMMFRYKATP